MSNVLKKIFEGVCDEEVHEAFIKFSRGKFNDRYLLEGKAQKDKWSIKTSAEHVNCIVEMCLKNAPEKIAVSGTIISTMNLRGERGYLFEPEEKIKQFMRIKQLIVNSEIERDKLLDLIKKQPRAFYALSFKTDSFELKTKAKAPKSAKPSNSKDKEVKADFCSLKTNNSEIIKELFFDLEGWKEVKIKHVIDIEDIELPLGVTDPVQMREQAKRKGKIIRKIIADGKEEIKEKEFSA